LSKLEFSESGEDLTIPTLALEFQYHFGGSDVKKDIEGLETSINTWNRKYAKRINKLLGLNSILKVKVEHFTGGDNDPISVEM
jgi:hypothetical protein